MATQPVIVVDIKNMPEVIWACRHEMAEFLRTVADEEPIQAVAERLREVAQIFEAGVQEL